MTFFVLLPALTILGAGIAGIVTGPRDVTNQSLCGVPKYNFDLCSQEMKGVKLAVSTPAQGQAQFDNIPLACMVLSTVLTGACDPSQGPAPVPCGSACILYANITDGQLDEMKKHLGVYGMTR